MLIYSETKRVKSRRSLELLQQPGVCGVGVERDERGGYVLAVHLDAAQAEAGKGVPDTIEEFPVRRVLSGPFVKQ